jgi:hypothetical protein
VKVVLHATGERGRSKTVGPLEGHEAVFKAVHALRDQGYLAVQQERLDIVCDFCSDPVVHWCYQIPAGRPVIGIVSGGESETHFDADGKWGACDDCHHFIQRGDWGNLEKRSLENMMRIFNLPADDPQVKLIGGVMVKNAHGHFRSLWNGSPPSKEKTDDEILSDLLGES